MRLKVVGVRELKTRLVALGVRTRRNKDPLAPLRPVARTGPSVADVVAEDREDRI